MSQSSLIVQREVATIRQVEEALARQVLYGGDLATNLLEVASVEEWRLAAVVAESFGKSPAPAGPLPTPAAGAIAMIPSDLANKRTVLPLDVDGERLLVVLAEPLPRDEEEQLAFALGVRIEARIALYPRVREGIAAAYGVPLDRRVERLLAKLGGARDSGPPASKPPLLQSSPPIEPPPRPKSIPPFRLSPAYGTSQVQHPASSPLPSRTTTNAGFPAPQPPGTVAGPSIIEVPIAMGMQAHPAVHEAITVPPPVAAPAVVKRTQTGQYLPAVTAPAPAPARTFVKATTNAVRPFRRRRGPLGFELAKEELQAAADRDGLLDLFFEFARQFFDYSALFIAHGDLAEGRDAFGDGTAREEVVGIGVPLDMPSMLTAARDQKDAVFVTLSSDGVDAVLAHDLGRKPGTIAMALPLLVRGRAVALLYADAGSHGIDREAIKDVVTFAQMVGQGFEKLIVRKKLAGFQAATPGSQVGKVAIPEAILTKNPPSRPPDSAARVEALSRAIGAPPSDRPGAFRPVPAPAPAPVPAGETGWARKPPTNPETPVARGSMPPVLNPEDQASSRPGLAVPLQPLPEPAQNRPPSSPPLPLNRPIVGPQRASKPPPKALAEVRMPTGPPIPREEGAGDEAPIDLTVPRMPGHSIPSIDAQPLEEHDAAALLAEIEMAELQAAQTVERVVIIESRDEPEDDFEEEQGISSVAVPPHRPPSPRAISPLSLPSVIVDIDQELLVLVDRVAFGQDDGQAEGELLRQGQQAMAAIMSRFPGPVTVDRSQLAPPLPRASECGNILRLVARQRRVALPFVLDMAVSEDPAVRFWATFLLSELTYAEAVPTIIVRLYDPDPRVRMAARAAAKATSDVAHEALLAEIGKVLRDPDPTRSARIGVIEALGEMREPLAVPVLIRALSDKDEEIATVARRALIAITRQDHQRDDKRWLAWWGQNSSRHRIEWLIDALNDETPGIRRAAGDELKHITSETFGYYDDLPKRERERAQQRFRDWWSQEGKARFVRP